MRKILITITAAVLTFALYGCKDLDKLAEIEELASMMETMGMEQQNDSLDADSVSTFNGQDSVVYDAVSFKTDSMSQSIVQTAIKKVKLEGHDYWTIVGVGEKGGGTGITHSESCWCRKLVSK